jgi:hypothetical protein
MFRTTLVQSSMGTVYFPEAEQLEREPNHYRAYVMIGATNKIHKFVDHRCSYYLTLRTGFGVLGDLQGDHAECHWKVEFFFFVTKCLKAVILPSSTVTRNRISLT